MKTIDFKKNAYLIFNPSIEDRKTSSEIVSLTLPLSVIDFSTYFFFFQVPYSFVNYANYLFFIVKNAVQNLAGLVT